MEDIVILQKGLLELLGVTTRRDLTCGVGKKMGFHEKYTTEKKISDEAINLSTLTSKELENLSKNKVILEKDKVILSNDAFALCEALELLNNRLGGLR